MHMHGPWHAHAPRVHMFDMFTRRDYPFAVHAYKVVDANGVKGCKSRCVPLLLSTPFTLSFTMFVGLLAAFFRDTHFFLAGCFP
jgi:hypothetical protein